MKKKHAHRTVHSSSLRTVRDALDMTQDEFAANFGVPKFTVENLEMGRSTLDDRLILRIAAFAGVVPESLREGNPLGPDGRPYNRDSFTIWKNMQWNEEDANILINRAAESLKEMLCASVFSPKQERRSHLLNQLLLLLDQFVQDEVERHGLKDSINALLESKTKRVSETLELREIQKRMKWAWKTLLTNVAPELANLPPRAQAIFTEARKPIFSRAVMFPTTSGQMMVNFGTRDFKIEYTVTLSAKGSKTYALTVYERDSVSLPVPPDRDMSGGTMLNIGDVSADESDEESLADSPSEKKKPGRRKRSVSAR